MEPLNLGNLQFRFNRFESAIELYRQSYELAVQLGHLPLQAQLAGTIASVFLKQGKAQEAISLLKQAVQTCRELDVEYPLLRSLGNLGAAYRLIGELERAGACYQESLGLSRSSGDQRSLADDLRSLASVAQELGDTDEALEYAEEALKVADQLGDPNFIWSAERILANNLRKIPARHHEVWQHYQRAMETAETLRRDVRADQDRIDLYSSHQYSVYEEAACCLLDNGEIKRAFEIAERFKSRLLLDVIAERATGNLSQPETAQQLLARAETVGSETSIASYFITRDETILFFIPPGCPGVEYERIPFGLNVYEEWSQRWSDLLPGSASHDLPSSLSAVQKALEELDAILVRPLRGCLKRYGQTKRLLLIPHRFLHSVPIHAARNPETGRYLAEELTVTYLPALRLWRTPEPYSRKDLTLLAVGEPLTNLMALPAALAEAKAVANLFGANVLSGSEATVQAFVNQARQVSIIHLACHCKFDPQHPSRSHLLMAGNEPLTAEAISLLQLNNIDLVSMAACESSRVRPGGVDESLGLTRAWLISDVRFVLGAQWEVDDETSRVFMLDFYNRVREGVDYLDAYDAAQRSIMNRPASDDDPRLWAPFILTGYS